MIDIFINQLLLSSNSSCPFSLYRPLLFFPFSSLFTRLFFLIDVFSPSPFLFPLPSSSLMFFPPRFLLFLPFHPSLLSHLRLLSFSLSLPSCSPSSLSTLSLVYPLSSSFPLVFFFSLHWSTPFKSIQTLSSVNFPFRSPAILQRGFFSFSSDLVMIFMFYVFTSFLCALTPLDFAPFHLTLILNTEIHHTPYFPKKNSTKSSKDPMFYAHIKLVSIGSNLVTLGFGCSEFFVCAS